MKWRTLIGLGVAAACLVGVMGAVGAVGAIGDGPGGLGGLGVSRADAADGPVALTLDGPSQGAVLVAGSNGMIDAGFFGSAASGHTVTVDIDVSGGAGAGGGGSGERVCETVAAADDTWRCTVPALPDFFGDVVVRAGDDVVTHQIGALNPPAFSTGQAGGVATTDGHVTVNGSSFGGALVQVLVDASPACSAAASPSGEWSCALTLTEADVGVTTLTATQQPPYASSPSAPTPPVELRFDPAPVFVPIRPLDPVPPSVPEGPGSGSGAGAGGGAAGGGDGSGGGGSSGAGVDGTAAAETGSGAAAGVVHDDMPAGASARGTSGAAGVAGDDADGRGVGSAGAVNGAAGVPERDGGSATREQSGAVVATPSVGAGATAVEGAAGGSPVAAAGDPARSENPPTAEGWATGGWADPSGFGTTLQAPTTLPWANPAFAVSALGIAAGFLLLLALPLELLQSTVRENYDRITSHLRPLERLAVARRRRAPKRLVSAAAQVGLIAVSAIIMSFADPSTGFDLKSLRLVLALGLVLVIVNYTAIAATHLLARPRRSLPTPRPAASAPPYGPPIHSASPQPPAALGGRIAVRPLGLLLVLASVLISRCAGIQPGLVFGLVLGLELGRRLTPRAEGRLAAAVSLVLLGLGVGSWLLFGALAPGWRTAPTFENQLAADVLTGITVETITALLIALLPLTFLDGAAVWGWSRRIWAGLYLVSATAFALILLPLPSVWVEVPTLLSPWTIGFALFTLASIGVWLGFRLTAPQAASAAAAAAAASVSAPVSTEASAALPAAVAASPAER